MSSDPTVNLMRRFGGDDERAWATDPNGPRTGPGSLVGRVLWALDEDSWKPHVEDDDVLDAIELLSALRAEADRREHRIIAEARRRGVTWREVAEALGQTSAQAVQQRHERQGERLKTTR